MGVAITQEAKAADLQRGFEVRTIIAGSRKLTWADKDAVYAAIAESGFEITEVLSGQCEGADLIGEQWARDHGIHVDPYPADWDRYGLAAGPIRNQDMVARAQAIIVVYRHKLGKGSRDVLNRAKHGGLQIYLKELP